MTDSAFWSWLGGWQWGAAPSTGAPPQGKAWRTPGPPSPPRPVAPPQAPESSRQNWLKWIQRGPSPGRFICYIGAQQGPGPLWLHPSLGRRPQSKMEGRSQERHTQRRGPRSGGESQPPPTIPECLEGTPGAQDKSKSIGHLGEVVVCWLTHPQNKHWFAGFDDFLGVTASAIASLNLPACENQLSELWIFRNGLSRACRSCCSTHLANGEGWGGRLSGCSPC